MKVFNTETLSYDDKTAATSSMVINIRSSKGIINQKVELDVVIDENAFINGNQLTFIWSQESFIVSRSTADASTILWSSVDEDANYQAKIRGEKINKFYEENADVEGVVMPQPYATTIKALPQRMSFMFAQF